MKKMNQSGFAVVYGLVILFVASLAGISLMYMSGKDKVAAADYIKMRSAAIAAHAALQACEGQMAEQPQVVFNILNKFTTHSNYKWLLGSDVATATSETKVYLKPGENNSPFFSARIMAFDPQDCLLQIEGIGRGMAGGTKRVIGIYELGGVEFRLAPKHALYLGRGVNNSDMSMKITGNVYLGPNNTIQSTDGWEIMGNLKIAPGGSTTINGLLTITGNAYFQGNIRKQNSGMTINGDAGFERDFELINYNLTLNGKGYINGDDVNGNGMINNTGLVKYYSSGGFDPLEIGGSKEAVSSKIDIASELGMSSGTDPVTTIVNNIETFITSSGGTIHSWNSAGLDGNVDGWNLNGAYASKDKWNGFLVIKIGAADEVWINRSGGVFNGKVIWIIERQHMNLTNWYSSGDASNTLLYVKGNGSFSDFGSNSTKFRGYIYNSSTVNSTYKFKPACEIEGGVYHSETNTPQFNDIAGDKFSLNYNANVMKEFVDLGLVTIPGGVTDGFQLVDVKIRPFLLGMHY